MKRQFIIWTLFATFLTVGLAAMGWISLTIIRLDRTEADARQRAQVEENVRLALWRMDSALGQVIAQENVRPAHVYSAFYPLQRAYDKEVGEIRQTVYMPSPLLDPAAPYILLYFQIGPSGMPTSPQVPEGKFNGLVGEEKYADRQRVSAALVRLAELNKALSRQSLLAALPAERPPATGPALVMESNMNNGGQQAVTQNDAQGTITVGNTFGVNGGSLTFNSGNSITNNASRQNYNIVGQLASPQEQQQRSVNEYQARVQWTNPNGKNSDDMNNARLIGNADGAQGPLTPLWLGEKLILARRATVNGQEYVQGCWLDWPSIRRSLIDNVADLLPAADLRPLDAALPEQQPRMMATLPVLLVPGALPEDPLAPASPIRLSLLIAWACVLMAGAAVGVMLRSSLVLSERRAAFVLTVTHELRTPLTTLRMYGEMLSEGMVDEPKRQRYLGTLRSEADRLGRLVDNVLAYSRIERGKAATRVEAVTVQQLLERSRDRLADRAAQAQMQLCVEMDIPAAVAMLKVDTSAVEQILFNLVDNACKYAAGAADRRLHLQAERNGRRMYLRLRDHGPGIVRSEAKRLFRPFIKSRRDASSNIPGVGLGLTLSRRLARQMGGELWIDTSVSDGACLVLELAVGEG